MILIFLLLAAAAAQPADDDLLSRGRERVLEAAGRMPRYTCTQTVDRSEFEQAAPHLDQKSCDRILANRANGLSRMEPVRSDRLRLEVEVTDDGREVFSWPGDARDSSERVQDFAGEGQMGTGAFGPFLINIFGAPGVTFRPEGAARIDGVEARQYRYVVPLAASRYYVQAGGATRVVPYEGRFWLDPETGNLRRLLVRTGELSRSTGNCEGETTVDFARARIGEGEHLLASKSVLHVVRRDAAELENVTTYAACHEFRGESAIHFDVEDTPAASPQPAAAPASKPAQGIPPGVRVTVRFAAGIDSAVSAAGDLLPALVSHSDARPRKRVLPLGGAPARCRLTRVESDVRAGKLNASVDCDAVEIDGRWVPFAAVLNAPAELLNQRFLVRTYDYQKIQGRRSPGRGGTFSFPLTNGRAQAGAFTSEWITVAK